mmetsp:Transcript_26414/g.75724  ORF Transcript_26414/g.75724 Transcript_26414/m.75724 type:complete len:104 (-) Transcript_26414:285-596(-)
MCSRTYLVLIHLSVRLPFLNLRSRKTTRQNLTCDGWHKAHHIHRTDRHMCCSAPQSPAACLPVTSRFNCLTSKVPILPVICIPQPLGRSSRSCRIGGVMGGTG